MELLLFPFADDATFNDPIGLLEPGERATVQYGDGFPGSSSAGRAWGNFRRGLRYLPNLETKDRPGAAYPGSDVAERDGERRRMRADKVFKKDGWTSKLDGHIAGPNTFVGEQPPATAGVTPQTSDPDGPPGSTGRARPRRRGGSKVLAVGPVQSRYGSRP